MLVPKKKKSNPWTHQHKHNLLKRKTSNQSTAMLVSGRMDFQVPFDPPQKDRIIPKPASRAFVGEGIPLPFTTKVQFSKTETL